MTEKIGIITGGGDVPPLNAVIESLRKKCHEYGIILIGFKRGWKGIIKNDYIDLTNILIPSHIGGTYLKSSRINLSKVRNRKNLIENNLYKLGINALIVIGGEDTISNSFYLKNIPQIIISKTIDNDVGIINRNKIINYFTLGYPTAAEKISSFVSLSEGLRTTAYSHERIIIVESMGMHTGWLALAASIGGPDYVIIPEYPIDYEDFKEKILGKYLSQKNLILVVAEGSKWKDGSFVSANQNDIDEFDHPRFKGAAYAISERLKKDLKKSIGTRNVNFVNPSYLYRSGKPNELDFKIASNIGERAGELVKRGLTDSVFLSVQFNRKDFFIEELPFNNIKNIEEFHRYVPSFFYDKENMTATNEYHKFINNIIRVIPNINYGYTN